MILENPMQIDATLLVIIQQLMCLYIMQWLMENSKESFDDFEKKYSLSWFEH